MNQNKLFEIIAKILKVPVDKINVNSLPSDFDGWDSLKHMNIILAVEEEFNIMFTEQQIDELDSVNNIINVIKENLDK